MNQRRPGEDTEVGIRRSLILADAMKLKQEVAEGLTMKAVMFVSNHIQAMCDRWEDSPTRNNLLSVFEPGGSWKASKGETTLTSMSTAIKVKAFRDDVRELDRWEEAGKTLMRW